MDKRELSRKITSYLNKSTGFSFKFIDDFCDIADVRNRVFINVKLDHFAKAQILHAIARKGIKKARYLGVADNKEIRLYLPPPFEKTFAFATRFDPELAFTPSRVNMPELDDEADKILGQPEKIIKLEFPSSHLFI